MRILVISDTHVPARTDALPREVTEALASGPDMVIHAGDLTSPAILEHFEMAPHFKGVSGNMDPPEVSGSLPRERVIEVQGLRIGVLHGDGPGRGPDMAESLATWFDDADIVISGHTHRPHLVVLDGVYLFNPGSPTDPRGGSVPSIGWIEISGSDSFPTFSIVPLGAAST